MNNYFIKVKEATIFAFTVLIVFALAWTIYATVNKTWTDPKKLEATPSSILKSEDWNKLLSNMNSFSWSLAWWLAVPTWWIIAFNSNSCPNWWKAADGTSWTPDLRWVFIRWANDFWTWKSNDNFNIDVDRKEAWVGSTQWDAIRNITWKIDTSWSNINHQSFWETHESNTKIEWAFEGIFESQSAIVDAKGWPMLVGFKFDASKSPWVEIWDDNRPRNVALIYCVKE